jgi:hypothetical protein
LARFDFHPGRLRQAADNKGGYLTRNPPSSILTRFNFLTKCLARYKKCHSDWNNYFVIAVYVVSL